MLNLRFLYILILLTLLQGCKQEDENNLADYKPKFVVEGWIEEDGYPYVILTHNLPFFVTLDSAQLSQAIIRWAKVTVSDGITTEILTSRKDDRYSPPYLYKGNEIKGERKKKYTLKVEYAGNILTAETSIPTSVEVDAIWFTDKENHKKQLNIRFNDPPEEKNYYRVYTRTQNDKIFYPTLLSVQDDKYFNGKSLTLNINRGMKNNLTVKHEPYFTKGDTVYIKFATIPKEGFDFWSSFNDEVINASNPLIGTTGKISHNINGPGIGIWCGYAPKVYRVIAQ
ncbi:DUF4249 family protein [Pseudopedobacter beijingensis]|uniref:DUF4249 family protein n=1 Tax=Pseudopedobacter beijingensis TaxID=1207056 RepID=A0ABW4I929_9SPHI